MMQGAASGVFSLEEVAVRTGVDVTFVEQLVELGVIETHGGPARVFRCEVTLRIQKFVRLQRDLGINFEGAAVIVELLDRIDALELELRLLKAR